MYLDFEGYSAPASTQGDVTNVTSPDEISVWAEVASQAFGYEIDATVVGRIAAVPDVELLLAREGGQAVATALTFQTGDTIGIHQVGVPKEHRGKGLARMIMDHTMARCAASSSRYATLQASAAGAGIYRGLGFQEQFTITNYRRSPTS